MLRRICLFVTAAGGYYAYKTYNSLDISWINGKIRADVDKFRKSSEQLMENPMAETPQYSSLVRKIYQAISYEYYDRTLQCNFILGVPHGKCKVNGETYCPRQNITGECYYEFGILKGPANFKIDRYNRDGTLSIETDGYYCYGDFAGKVVQTTKTNIITREYERGKLINESIIDLTAARKTPAAV